MLEDELKLKMKALEPEIDELRGKVKYLSEVNEKVKKAKKVAEGFVEEVVSVNELLAQSLKRKNFKIQELSNTKMRRSES
jgi:hypothetical protein